MEVIGELRQQVISNFASQIEVVDLMVDLRLFSTKLLSHGKTTLPWINCVAIAIFYLFGKSKTPRKMSVDTIGEVNLFENFTKNSILKFVKIKSNWSCSFIMTMYLKKYHAFTTLCYYAFTWIYHGFIMLLQILSLDPFAKTNISEIYILLHS